MQQNIKQNIKQNINQNMLTFIRKSPTAFHAVAAMQEALTAKGFTVLSEKEHWTLQAGGRYLVTRGGSALIAFVLPKDFHGFRIMASHSDSPTFKIKENPELNVEKSYVKLNVEKYGGMLMAPWFDRPLSIAGRVAVADPEQGIRTILIDLDRDAALIPNLAIHMNREANNGYPYNAQKDMLPLYGLQHAAGTFLKQIAEAAGVTADGILGHDLFLYNRMPGSVWGAENEFISAPRLDDLECAYSSMCGLLAASEKGQIRQHAALHCVFDNEEVGSGTRQGADSTFLYDTLRRIEDGCGKSQEDYYRDIADSFLVSADNAHALHPNHVDCADPVNRPVLNGGIVLKFNADQKYCTDGISAALFRQLCRKAGVPLQVFTNRSDMAGGSTLGNLSGKHVAVTAVDIGLPQLAMHSPYETAGTGDLADLQKVAALLFD